MVDSLGTIVQQVDYLPYGEKCRNITLISGENDYLYGGKEFQAPVFNIPWYDSQARFQTTDGIFVSLDPQCEKYYSISPYAYCAGNPVKYVDRDGGIFETAWDIANVVAGVASFAANVAAGNIGGAVVDAVGIVADAASVLAPGIPGGASAGIKAIRAGKIADRAIDAARAADHASDAVKAGDKTIDAASKGSCMEKLREKATIGQEAHRQIEAQEMAIYGGENEHTIKNIIDAKGKTITVRKDLYYSRESVGIIKPDTPSGHKSAARREKLMQDNGYKTKTIYYDPKDPAYLPGSPTYIGPPK